MELYGARYNYFGVRGLRDDEHYKPGDYCRESKDWDLENDCPSQETLGGTCAIAVYDSHGNFDEEESIIGASAYSNRLALIAGDSAYWGYDPDEIVIKNAVVIKIY